MTPTDLTLITGLRFGPRALEFYDDWRTLPYEHLLSLLGLEPPRDSIFVPRSWFREQIVVLSGVSSIMMDVGQIARLMILMMMGCSFLHTRRDTVNLNVLRSLEDLSVIGEYDWGGAALGTMYREMGDLSRGMFLSLGGMHFAWEVCTVPVCWLSYGCFFFNCPLFLSYFFPGLGL